MADPQPPSQSERHPRAGSGPDAPAEQQEKSASSSGASSSSFLSQLTAFETALIAGGVLLFLVLLYEMEPFLSPPLLGAAGAILLWPLRRQRTVRSLLLAGAFLLLLWFAAELSSILIPFGSVYLLAYLFEPLVHVLEKRYGVKRWISSLGVTLLVVGLFVLVVLLLVPSIISQVEILARRGLDAFTSLRDWIQTTPLLDSLDEQGIIDRAEVTAQMNEFIQEQSQQIAGGLTDVAQFVLRSIESIFGVVMLTAVLPVVLFYTLKDYRFINPRLIELFPTFGGDRQYLVHTGSVVGNYLRGQLTISAIGAVNVSFWFIIFDVPFALLLGLLAGLLNMIPNIGAIITHILALAVAFIFSETWLFHMIVVLGVLTTQALIEQTFLTPKILSHHVGLHPVLIIISLFVFGYFLGVFGLLVAVPCTALIMTLYKNYREEMTLDLSSNAPTTETETASEKR